MGSKSYKDTRKQNLALRTVIASIAEIKNFTCDEVIPYIENKDAIKDVESEINELSTFQEKIWVIIADMDTSDLR